LGAPGREVFDCNRDQPARVLFATNCDGPLASGAFSVKMPNLASGRFVGCAVSEYLRGRVSVSVKLRARKGPVLNRLRETLLVPVALGGCTAAPAQNILGSFFPSWLLSAFLGLLGAGIVRFALSYRNLNESVPLPPITYGAIALAMTLAIWLIWFGH